jgi:hypothetical protein
MHTNAILVVSHDRSVILTFLYCMYCELTLRQWCEKHCMMHITPVLARPVPVKHNLRNYFQSPWESDTRSCGREIPQQEALPLNNLVHLLLPSHEVSFKHLYADNSLTERVPAIVLRTYQMNKSRGWFAVHWLTDSQSTEPGSSPALVKWVPLWRKWKQLHSLVR